MIEAGASGVHFEDQLASVKKCGHMGGKVLVPTREAVAKLVSARLAACLLYTSLALLLAGCGEKPQMNPGMPQVSVITVQPQRTPIISELPGRVDAVRDAQIRSRVTGIVQKIAFEQGGDVKENQLLFKIDPAPYKAAYDQATAQLKQAQANLFSAKLLADRYGPLVKANAVSKQEYDNAVAAYRQADATVAAAKAAQDNASINLGYCLLYTSRCV